MIKDKKVPLNFGEMMIQCKKVCRLESCGNQKDPGAVHSYLCLLTCRQGGTRRRMRFLMAIVFIPGDEIPRFILLYNVNPTVYSNRRFVYRSFIPREAVVFPDGLNCSCTPEHKTSLLDVTLQLNNTDINKRYGAKTQTGLGTDEPHTIK